MRFSLISKEMWYNLISQVYFTVLLFLIKNVSLVFTCSPDSKTQEKAGCTVVTAGSKSKPCDRKDMRIMCGSHGKCQEMGGGELQGGAFCECEELWTGQYCTDKITTNELILLILLNIPIVKKIPPQNE